VPTVTEEKEVETVKDHIEGKPSSCEEFPTKPAFTHCNLSIVKEKRAKSGSTVTVIYKAQKLVVKEEKDCGCFCSFIA
jgi:hypothetical protein